MSGNSQKARLHDSRSPGKKRKRTHHDFEYISNDPQENADNFDPKWARFRELNTDEERYRAIRERWGNSSIPDPKINLTYRHKHESSFDQVKSGMENNLSAPKFTAESSRPKVRESRCRVIRPARRSRSCTRPYEELISNIEKNYKMEYSQLMLKQNAELQEMLQFQSLQLFSFNYGLLGGFNGDTGLKRLQKQQVFELMSNHNAEIKNFIGRKLENIDACKRYMEEIRAFITFYQKINDSHITLQMTDEQYEHFNETEKMYSLYGKFYASSRC